MDIQALVQALGNTLDPSLGKQAEAWLEEVRESLTYKVYHCQLPVKVVQVGINEFTIRK